MRHIPDVRADLGDVSFDAALREALEKRTDYDTGKWLFVPPRYTEYRYILGTRGARPLVCIGINPSTAMPERLDRTLESVQRIALNNGYDSFIMFNVCARRATDPDDMEKEMNADLHRENMKAFDYILSLSDRPAVWAAWGGIIEKRAWLRDCLKDMILIGERRRARWVKCGPLSVKGHPHHPLYLKSTLPLESFDAAGYLARLMGGGKMVIVVPYSEAWPRDFEEIALRIRAALSGLLLRIEHVGSTSVPGLSAKPIIDIDAVIGDQSALGDVVSALEKIGYRYEGDLGIAGREAFKYEGEDPLPKHHLYVCPRDSAELKRHIAFRDYLLSHPGAAEEYGRIKEEGAALYPYDIDKYIGFKAPFIGRIYREIGI